MRVNIFLKANVELRDPLLALRRGEQLLWNGINECLRPLGHTARVIHETLSRSDIVMREETEVPALLKSVPYDFGAHSPKAQFHTALFQGKYDAVVLSILPDLFNQIWRHRGEGFLLYESPQAMDWPIPHKQWLTREFDRMPLLRPEESMANLRRIIGRIRENGDKPIIVANVCSWVPGEDTHCYEGIQDSATERIKQFNLALIGLSREEGISLLDTDRLFAGAGAQACRFDVAHPTALGCRLVAEETVRLLQEYGCLG